MSDYTIPLPDVAKRLGCSLPTLRKAIKRQDAENKPDSLRFCPGGRVENTKYYVIRAIFETVMAGKAIDAHLRAPIAFDAAELDQAA